MVDRGFVRQTARVTPSLRRDHVEAPHPSRLAPGHPRYAEIMALHAAAVASSVPVYRDPASGFTVFTARFLADRGYCCESGCRHCPYVI